MGVSFDEYPFKRLVVLKFFQQRQPFPFSFRCHGSVEHGETSSARTSTGTTGHREDKEIFARCQFYELRLLFLSDPTLMAFPLMTFSLSVFSVEFDDNAGFDGK